MVPLKDIKHRITDDFDIDPGSGPGIHRYELPVAKIDLLAWLYHQDFAQKTYCAGRDDRFKIAGVGAACIVTAKQGDLESLFAQMRPLLHGSDNKVRFYGGIKFNFTSPVSEPWHSFGSYHFTVPRFEFVQRGEDTFFAVNVLMDPDGRPESLGSILPELDRLNMTDAPVKDELSQYIESAWNPDKTGWVRNVEQALELIGNDELQKIVLSGQLHLRFQDPMPPNLLMLKLIGQNSNSFHFYFQTGEQNAFMGITPERLYRREGSAIKTEAIAGTRPRGADAAADDALANDLQSTDKDLREHRWVSDVIKSGLEPLCSDVQVPERERIIKLRHVQHLQTLFRGTLKPGIDDTDIIQQLHPTPAVGGYPGDTALAHIARIEGFDRGWYAGPVGWVGKDVSGFAVGIRSGLVHGNFLTLYAGSGIVNGSDPEREWEENQTKLMNFTKLFRS